MANKSPIDGDGQRGPGREATPVTLLPPVAVVQPLPGIGDMVWHLPHIRAIAAASGAPVTLLAKPRSLADQLFAGESTVGSILSLDLNPGGRRGRHDGVTGLVRLARLMQDGRFGTIILLHHSVSIAAAAWLARIPRRLGYGRGLQRIFLNHGPFLPRDVARLHQHTRATRYLEAAGIPLPSAEPTVPINAATRAGARLRLNLARQPFVAVGIGSSEPLRQWGVARFTELTAEMLDAGWPRVVLLGGPEDTGMADAIRTRLGGRAQRVGVALGWHLTDVTGLLAEAAFYVGNNTGVMNMAAAVGIRAYALFGTTKPFDHASQIVPITALDTGVHDGMVRLPLDAVLAVIRADRGWLSPGQQQDALI
jgi:heptosyltransferase II